MAFFGKFALHFKNLRAGIDPVTLRSVVGAIRRSEASEVKYQSLSSPEPRWRWIRDQAAPLERRYGIELATFAQRLKRSRRTGGVTSRETAGGSRLYRSGVRPAEARKIA